MSRLGRIALWEWQQQFRQWSFVLTLVLPFGLVGLLWWTADRAEGEGPVVVAVWDETGRWLRWLHEVGSEAIGRPLVVYPLAAEDTMVWQQLLERVERGQWIGLLHLRPAASGLEARLWSHPGTRPLMRALLRSLEQRMRVEMVQQSGVPEELTRELLWPISVSEHPLPQRTFGSAQILLGVAGLILVIDALVWAARSLTEERFSRVTELLVSIVSAGEFIAGKFLGLSGIGLAQTAVLVGLLESAGKLQGNWLASVGVLVVSYGFMSALGLWLAVRARSEAQLHGFVVLVLAGLSAGGLLVVIGGEALGSTLLVAPLWMIWAVLLYPVAGTYLLVGAALAVALTAALLRDAARCVHWLIAPPAR